MLNLLILDVVNGTGITKSVFLAQKDLFSMPKKSVLQSVINVLHSILKLACALHASKVTML